MLFATIALAIGGVVVCAACGARRDHGRLARPHPTLAGSTEAATELGLIRDAWHDPEQHGRDELRLRIDRFLKKYPDDDSTAIARVYLVFLLLEQHGASAPGIDENLAVLAKLAPSATNDFALVARARVMRLRGRPDQAFDLLSPLAGKIVDKDALEQFQMEVTLDAVAAHRDYEAIAYMDSWLRNADEDDHEIARQKITEALAAMSPVVLESSLRAMREASAENLPGGGYSLEMQRLLATRLASFALDKNDARLAQWLVDPDAGAPVLGLDAGLMVSALATRRQSAIKVQGRTIGLVLPTSSSSLRDAAADVARGVAWALELPRSSPSSGDATRLVTRDDGGRGETIDAVLEDVASDGATVILAGFDPRTARRAIAWSERTGVPVVTLAGPSDGGASRFAWMVGEPHSTALNALLDTLVARRETKVALLSDASTMVALSKVIQTHPKLQVFEPVPCELESENAYAPRFPIAAWEKAGFRTWLVAGPASCARDVMRELGGMHGALFALSLEAGGQIDRDVTARVVQAAAGLFPVSSDPAALDGDLKRFATAFGNSPNWDTALGRDAALLARRAVAGLPLDTTTVPAEVARRRDTARQGLAAAHAALWTSEAQGFDADSHRLPRTVRIVQTK